MTVMLSVLSNNEHYTYSILRRKSGSRHDMATVGQRIVLRDSQGVGYLKSVVKVCPVKKFTGHFSRLADGRPRPIFILYHSSNILSSKMSHFFENISSQISKKLSSNA